MQYVTFQKKATQPIKLKIQIKNPHQTLKTTTTNNNNNTGLEGLKDLLRVKLGSEQWHHMELMSSETQQGIHHGDAFPHRVVSPGEKTYLKMERCLMHKHSDRVISGFIAAIRERYTLVAPLDLYHGSQKP